MSGVYVWDLTCPGNACGVAAGESGALRALAEALRAAPVGAEGILRGAILPTGIRQGYAYTDPIATGLREKALPGGVAQAEAMRGSRKVAS